jgi:hypothetical protein
MADRTPDHAIGCKSRRTSHGMFPAINQRNRERSASVAIPPVNVDVRARRRLRRCKLRRGGTFVLPSNVTSAVDSAETRCLRTLRPFLTHFDPQRHREPNDKRRAPADQGAFLRTSTGQRRGQTATSISAQCPESRYTTINQADISVWHDTRFCKVPLQQLIPVTDAKLHGKRREQAGLGKKFPGILAHCLSDAQCGGRLVDVSRWHSALMPGAFRLR